MVKTKKQSDKRRDTPEYWEARLKRMGLVMTAGVGISREVPGYGGEPVQWLNYGHKVHDLDYDGKRIYEKDGEGEELAEWPLSLL